MVGRESEAGKGNGEKRMTRQARQRKAFEKAFAKRYGVGATVARKARTLFEKHTGRVASKKELSKHPRIAEKKVRSAKAAIAREKKQREKEKAGVRPSRLGGTQPSSFDRTAYPNKKKGK